MPDFARLPRLLAALALCLPLLASAQAPAPMSDAERARRDAEKVFSFIKFQTVPAKPTAEAPRKPARPAAAATAPAPAIERPAVAARPPEPLAPEQAAAAAVKPAAAPAPIETPPTAQPTTLAAPAAASSLVAPQPTAVLPVTLPPMAAPAATEPEPADADDADDSALQLQNFVAPVLTPAVQATLGPGARNVKVRFTVQADGRVSQADAAANVPHRLAKPAVEAILQWRFAPLPQPRTVDVEIAFRRD